MSKRTSLSDKENSDTKTAKAISALISSKKDQDEEELEKKDTEKAVEINDDKPTMVQEIVIEKVSKKDKPKRATYYLNPEIIKKIDALSKQSGTGKSELVQKLLDDALRRVKIKWQKIKIEKPGYQPKRFSIYWMSFYISDYYFNTTL